MNGDSVGGRTLGAAPHSGGNGSPGPRDGSFATPHFFLASAAHRPYRYENVHNATSQRLAGSSFTQAAKSAMNSAGCTMSHLATNCATLIVWSTATLSG